MGKTNINITVDNKLAIWLQGKKNKSGFVNDILDNYWRTERNDLRSIEDIDRAIEILEIKLLEFERDIKKDIDVLVRYKENFK